MPSQSVIMLVFVGAFMLLASASSPRPPEHPLVIGGELLGLGCIVRGLYLWWKERSDA